MTVEEHCQYDMFLSVDAYSFHQAPLPLIVVSYYTENFDNIGSCYVLIVSSGSTQPGSSEIKGKKANKKGNV